MVYSEIIKHVEGRMSLLQQKVNDASTKSDFDAMNSDVVELTKELKEWITLVSMIPKYIKSVSMIDVGEHIDSQIEAELGQYEYTQKSLSEKIKLMIESKEIKIEEIIRGIKTEIIEDEFGEKEEIKSGGKTLITLTIAIKKIIESRGKTRNVIDFHRVTLEKSDFEKMIYEAKIPSEIYEVDKNIITNLVKLVDQPKDSIVVVEPKKKRTTK